MHKQLILTKPITCDWFVWSIVTFWLYQAVNSQPASHPFTSLLEESQWAGLTSRATSVQAGGGVEVRGECLRQAGGRGGGEGGVQPAVVLPVIG